MQWTAFFSLMWNLRNAIWITKGIIKACTIACFWRLYAISNQQPSWSITHLDYCSNHSDYKLYWTVAPNNLVRTCMSWHTCMVCSCGSVVQWQWWSLIAHWKQISKWQSSFDLFSESYLSHFSRLRCILQQYHISHWKCGGSLVSQELCSHGQMDFCYLESQKSSSTFFVKFDVGLLPPNATTAMSTLRNSNVWATEALNVWTSIETFLCLFARENPKSSWTAFNCSIFCHSIF